MKTISIAATALFLLFTTLSFVKKSTHPLIEKEVARCYGSSPCNACSSCAACKHCRSGGTCGVCARPVVKKQSSPAGQCKATTQKGKRCSRNATSNGYCWQHD